MIGVTGLSRSGVCLVSLQWQVYVLYRDLSRYELVVFDIVYDGRKFVFLDNQEISVEDVLRAT